MKIRTLICLSALVFLFFQTSAMASSFSISPQGQIEVALGDTVNFDLSFNVGDDDPLTIIGIYFDFIFDSDELSLLKDDITYNLPGFGSLSDVSPDDTNVRIDSASLGGSFTFVKNTPQSLLTIPFEVISLESFDGISDFRLESQIGTTGMDLRGMLLDDYMTTVQFEGAEGGSVGVPIPGAFLLLGSGMICLFGFRKRNDA